MRAIASVTANPVAMSAAIAPRAPGIRAVLEQERDHRRIPDGAVIAIVR
jgi:hypothetical protein